MAVCGTICRRYHFLLNLTELAHRPSAPGSEIVTEYTSSIKNKYVHILNSHHRQRGQPKGPRMIEITSNMTNTVKFWDLRKKKSSARSLAFVTCLSGSCKTLDIQQQLWKAEYRTTIKKSLGTDRGKAAPTNKLQDPFISVPAPVLPFAEGHFMLHIDAFDEIVGTFQLQERREKTIKRVGYWPWSLSISEQASNTAQRECLVISWSVLLLQL